MKKILFGVLLLLVYDDGLAQTVNSIAVEYGSTDSTYSKVPRNKSGEIHGTVKTFYTNGKKEGFVPYKNGRKSGTEKHFYRSGKPRSVTPWVDGYPYGAIYSYYENGKTESVTIMSNQRLVDGKRFYESGEISEKTTPAITGVLISGYSKSGKLISETPWIKGKKEGIAKTYYENGLLASEMRYVEGKKDGAAKEYSATGKLVRETVYEVDQVIQVREY